MTTSKSNSEVALMVTRAIERLTPKRSQRELALAMGFHRANMLSMIKRGEARVPFAKIPVVAEVLEIDPAVLVRACLREAWPGYANAITKVFGGILSKDERAWVSFFADVNVPAPPADPLECARLKAMILSWNRNP